MQTGSRTVVTTCPHAEMHFEKVAKQRNMQISVVDLAEIVAEAL